MAAQDWLTPVGLFVGGGLVMGLVTFGACARLQANARRGRNEIFAAYLTLASALLGTYLGFLTVSVWESRSAAESSARLEAADLLVLLRLSGTQPEPRRARLQDAVLRYTQSIQEKEWPRMMSENPGQLFHRSPELDLIWSILLEPGVADSPYASSAVDRLSALAAARESRLLVSTTKLSPYIWFTIGAGTLINLLLLMLLRVEEAKLHGLFIGCCAGLMLNMLWGIYDLQTPYAGSWSVTAQPFLEAAMQMKALTTR